MVFSPNDSPLAGREGSHLTGSKIGERLANEAATSVSLRVLPVKGGGEAFEVQARGELQLGLLIGESLCRASTTVHVGGAIAWAFSYVYRQRRASPSCHSQQSGSVSRTARGLKKCSLQDLL